MTILSYPGLLASLITLGQEHPDRICGSVAAAMGPAMRLKDGDIPHAELWADCDWTPTAQEYIRAGEFRYISPEFDLDWQSEKDEEHKGAALLAIGLVNRPFLSGMAPVELAPGETMSAVQVFMTGVWYHPWYGKFTVTPDDLKSMIDNQSEVFRSVSRNSDHPDTEMVVDYNHGSLAYTPEAAKAAAWVRGRKLFIETPEKPDAKATDMAGAVTASLGLKDIDPDELKALLGNTAQAQPPTGGNSDMNEKQIREVLGLGDDVTLTADHMGQALSKVAADNLALKVPVAVTTPDGEAQMVAADVAGQVVLTTEQYAALTAAQPEPGQIVLSQADLDALKADAAQGVTAAQKLVDKEVADALDAAQDAGTVKPAEREDLVKLAALSMDLFRANLANRSPVIDMAEHGSDETATAPDKDGVGAFIATREAELMTAGKKPATAKSMAMREAQRTFPADVFDAWRYA